MDPVDVTRVDHYHWLSKPARGTSGINMKILSFACLALLLLHVSVAFADDFVVPIIDKSASGSPLENIGSVTLSETIKDGKSTRSREIEWTVRNKSPKAIVTVVETLSIRYASGHSAESKNQYEAFFGPNFLKTGEAISFFRESVWSRDFGRLFKFERAKLRSHCALGSI
jgi:hypothetical protein